MEEDRDEEAAEEAAEREGDRSSSPRTRLVSRTPNPTATISIPVRFPGRRVQPISPATTNDMLTKSASAIVKPGMFFVVARQRQGHA